MWTQCGKERVGRTERLALTSIVCKRDSLWEAAVQHKELSPVLCADLEQWEGDGGHGRVRGPCIHTADSHFCTAETNTTL